MKGTIDLDTDTVKVMLTDARGTSVPWFANQGTHDYRNDVDFQDATITGSGTGGYPAGGWTLTGITVSSAVPPNYTWSWDAADVVAAIGGTISFRYGIYYKSRGGASSADELLGFVDFGTQTVTNATINITQTNQLGITAGTYPGP